MKTLFNFYLDEDVKYKVNNKLTRLNGVQTKGQLSALIRSLLQEFLDTPDEEVSKDFLNDMRYEYIQSQTLNKRSKL